MKQVLYGFLEMLIAGSALADEKFVIKPPLQRQLESLVLPEVRLGDTDIMDALLFLQKRALTSPQGAVRVPFVVHLPADFKPRHELLLDMKTVPFWEVLRHLCGQVGVECSIENQSVTIRPVRTPSAAPVTVRTEIPAPAEPAPGRGLSGRLGMAARPFVTGQNVHHAMSGAIQPKKSGSGAHRNLNGWPIDFDPRGEMSMNCVDQVKCKAKCCKDGACGCIACTCHNLKVEK